MQEPCHLCHDCGDVATHQIERHNRSSLFVCEHCAINRFTLWHFEDSIPPVLKIIYLNTSDAFFAKEVYPTLESMRI